MNYLSKLNAGLKGLAILAIASINLSVNAVTWPTTPLGATISAKPMTMLVAGKDHKMFYEAYNDASDIDGDGTLDIRFKPTITYYGLFDSTLCYTYQSTATPPRFEPTGIADLQTASKPGKCDTARGRWSGNWLNYMTTSRIDALKKVLYGGTREIDSTTETVLRRTYIPQDAHSWGKEYTDVATDGYSISDFTELSQPNANTRHFFGSLTANYSVNCSTLNNCSGLPPLLRIRQNVGSGKRVWEWASKERPVLQNDLSSGGFPSGTGAEQNFQVFVKVCATPYINDCKQYPNGGSPIYKPVGLLHDYGENDSMLFGLLTGSYDNHLSGGRLRKVVSSFSNEVSATTGIFNSGSAAPIITTFDKLRIRGFNQSSSSGEYWKSNPYADSAKAPTEGELVDWGNPIGEMLYEATRYFAGKAARTGAFNTSSTVDSQVGLSSATWDDPYSASSAAKAPYCARASFLTISDVDPSFDSDSVPGSYFNTSFIGDLTGLNAATLGTAITGLEDSSTATTSKITGLHFIGQSGTGAGSYDSAPTAKNVTSLGSIRGLAPGEPSKQGSYSSAAVAYYAKTVDLRAAGTTALQGTQTVDNYVVALSSPLPQVVAKLPNGKIITMVPFAKSVSGSSISSTKGNYQPTNQIVDFYVQTIANSGAGDANASINGGRYYAEFQINFEDVEQGGDHDMDAISRYVVKANSDNTLSISVVPTYQAGGIRQNMGYVISGTNRDGVYLVAQDETVNTNYFLNVPPGRSAGYCDVTTPPNDCAQLPTIGSGTTTFTFSPNASGTGATLLKGPLWYAAKYGGFVDSNQSKTPDKDIEWDSNNDGIPDTYFLVQNPLKLKESLKKAFDGIIEKNGSGGNVIANSTVLSTDALVYQATFNSTKWSGDLEAYRVTTSGVSASTQWKASNLMPAPAARNIIYYSDVTSGPKGKAFTWSNLSSSEQTKIGSSDILDFLRGDRSKELQNGGGFRDRAANNVLGDIATSSPFYVKDSGTVFIGANDGMLHAFDANTGVERFAFMPSVMLPRVSALTGINYNNSHQYFVDGDTAVSSFAQTPGANYLATTLGRGGKGLFGLNVTSPSAFSGSDVLWEYLDGATDLDLGYMLGRPVIAKMSDGTWAVVVGNGYNSASTKAVLYIFSLQTGALIKKIDTGIAGDNGLSTPSVRVDSSGRATTIYAGDLKGNVWKFDVSSPFNSLWAVANSGSPLYQAKDSANKAQPITAPITTAVQSTGSGSATTSELFVYFGTGSDFQVSDPSDKSPQTWYGIIDAGSVISTGRAELKSRTMSVSSTLSGKPVRTLSAAVANDMTGMKGWLIDLPELGERIVTASNYYKLAEPVLIASSVIPVVDECVPGGNGYLNAINPFTGARLTKPFFDVSDNGVFTDDVVNGNYVSSIDLGVGKPGEAIIIGNRLVVGGSKALIKDVRINTGVVPIKGRLSWREILLD
jgi:type IV pilus assembly protein PilY1